MEAVMSNKLYADIIIDRSIQNLDKTYQYAIPEEYQEVITVGTLVMIPFGNGNREMKGYVLGISTEPKIDLRLIKPIARPVEQGIAIESQLIYLAYWIKETFGGTMNDALKTVIPVKTMVKIKEKKSVGLNIPMDRAMELLAEYQRKKSFKARALLLETLIHKGQLDQDTLVHQYKISTSVIKGLVDKGIVKISSEQIYRNPIQEEVMEDKIIYLNEEQQGVVDHITGEYDSDIRATYLIHGVTGSGKTEVYMEIISQVIAKGKQVIFLIPEIALTYQMVRRFYQRFGNRISILNSKMSQGERYDQSVRAEKGEIDIMIGPRSALFTPFQNLGLIIVDEEHENSYKSENTPKYHGVEVAIKRAELSKASVILGSATPSLESYYKAKEGEYRLLTLTKRAKDASLPSVWIVDLREELKNKNRSMFSVKLRELMEDRLAKKEQIILFLNRRGYAGFVSCRSCGYVVKCPHCDISLTSHNNGTGVCHYCGHQDVIPKVCPACQSKYIAAFGTGTQKVEEMVRKEFPGARVLRMDMDTTKQKGGHEKIIAAFSKEEADILIGTQMIVKGHDFPKVTLVGILAADLSLHAGDFRASERTFQLLCQASGRAGRDILAGEVVIQSYHPDHYSIITAAQGDYESFYHQEMLYRKLMKYPPASQILLILLTSKQEALVEKASAHMGEVVTRLLDQYEGVLMIGPAPAALSKANDIYRRVIYLKHPDYHVLIEIKNYVEGYYNYSDQFNQCNLQFDFNPMSSY